MYTPLCILVIFGQFASLNLELHGSRPFIRAILHALNLDLTSLCASVISLTLAPSNCFLRVMCVVWAFSSSSTARYPALFVMSIWARQREAMKTAAPVTVTIANPYVYCEYNSKAIILLCTRISYTKSDYTRAIILGTSLVVRLM